MDMDDRVRQEYDEIKAILRGVAERQADAEARMDRAEERMTRAEARMDRSDARFDRRMRGFEKLVKIGMKEIAELRRLSRETDYKLNALIASQDRTEATLRAFMESLRKGGNGHGGRVR
jgi:division protein CdvB (Snf7/Vps24/ESCRT-III family)